MKQTAKSVSAAFEKILLQVATKFERNILLRDFRFTFSGNLQHLCSVFFSHDTRKINNDTRMDGKESFKHEKEKKINHIGWDNFLKHLIYLSYFVERRVKKWHLFARSSGSMRSTTRQKGWNKRRIISESHDRGKRREWVSKFIPLCLLHPLAKAISITQFNWKAYTVVKIFSQHTSWIFLQHYKLWNCGKLNITEKFLPRQKNIFT